MKNLLFILLLTLNCATVFSQSRKVSYEKLLGYYQSQKYVEAADYLKGIYGENSENAKGISKLAYTYMMANRLPEAEANYLKILRRDSSNISALFNLATINVKREHNEQAVKYYHDILKIDSTDFRVYKQLAMLTRKQAMPQKISYLRKASQLNPTDPDIAYTLAESYCQAKEYAAADTILSAALNADSVNLKLLNMKLPVSIGLKKYRTAIETGKKLFHYGDSSTFVANHLGRAYFLNSEYTNALHTFLIIKDESFDNEMLFHSISLCYRELKDFKNATLYLEKAIKQGISPKIASYYGLIGESYESLNLNKEANDAYKQGLLFENNGSLLYNIALVYETKLNDKKSAINYYTQYLKTIDSKEKPRLTSFINNKIAELTERLKREK